VEGEKKGVWSSWGKVWAQGLLRKTGVRESRDNTAKKMAAPGHVPVLCTWGANGAVGSRPVWTGGNGDGGASAVSSKAWRTSHSRNPEQRQLLSPGLIRSAKPQKPQQ